MNKNWDWLADDTERERRYGALSGIQKSWILRYVEGASEHPETFFESVLLAIEIKSLPANFDESHLLKWADFNRDDLTTAGIEAARRLGIFGAAGLLIAAERSALRVQQDEEINWERQPQYNTPTSGGNLEQTTKSSARSRSSRKRKS